MTNVPKILNYIIYSPRSPVTLDLYEAERYEPAIIVQSLVGNLVYYSNQGRYEPRLAKQWERTSPDKWEFKLHDGLLCENGEKINAESFRESLFRTIRYLAKSGDVPILSDLEGYEQFLSGRKEISGITFLNNTIMFKFRKPVRDGLVQILSFAPFGYICKENLKEDGSWKDETKFISSGPYKIMKVDIGTEYIIEKRPEWNLDFSKNAPDQIRFLHKMPSEMSENEEWIFDSFTNNVNAPEKLTKYPLVPEYISPIIFGNLQHGYFSNLNNRLYIKDLIAKHRSNLPETWGPHSRSSRFYPGQNNFAKAATASIPKLTLPNYDLVIEGTEPTEDTTPRSYSWNVLKVALNEAGIKYKFAGNDSTSKDVNNPNYDIRIRGSSIGGGVEAWGLRVLFCSDLGPNFPDPSGRICKAIVDYEGDRLSEIEFANRFLETVDSDCAIVPISHYGIQLYLSSGIMRESLSPALAILRFDKMDIR